MNLKRVQKLRDEIEGLRGSGGISSRTLQRLARKLGRKQHPRGKEPTWVSTILKAPPLSIPNHPGDLSRFTAKSILDTLEEDLDAIQESLEASSDV